MFSSLGYNLIMYSTSHLMKEQLNFFNLPKKAYIYFYHTIQLFVCSEKVKKSCLNEVLIVTENQNAIFYLCVMF